MIPELSQTEYLIVGVTCVLAVLVLARWYWGYYQESCRQERLHKFAKRQEEREAVRQRSHEN